MKMIAAVLCVLFAGVQLERASAAPADLEQILKGVATIAAPGSPGTVCAFGSQAFVVADGGGSGGLRQAVIAASRGGKGRIAICGHDGYLDPRNWSSGDTRTLMLNLIGWVAGGNDRLPLRIGVQINPALGNVLAGGKMEVVPLGRDNWLGQLAGCSAVILDPSFPRTEDQVKALRDYIEAGGGVILGHTGWGWLQLNPGKTLKNDLMAHRLTGPLGLAWGDGFASRDNGVAGYRISSPIPAALHANIALDVLLAADGKNADAKDLAQAGATIMEASRVVSDDSPLQVRLHKIQADSAVVVVPTEAQPLKVKDALPRLVLAMQLAELRQTPPEKVTAHPAARFFPGAVPADAKSVTKVIPVDTTIPRWHSTGLYAGAGQVISVTLPADAAGKHLRLRIGAHTDHTYHLSAWRRAPEISRDWPLDRPVTKLASPFGGLVYIEAPTNSVPAIVQVTIAGAVESPYFILGTTSVEQWRSIVRHHPAPWAELATDKLILTLKSAAVRQLDDPTAVLQHWNRVMDASATLAGWPLERPSPERIVNDADISAGYMHSGYPIMTMLDVTYAMVDLPKLKTLSAWGFYHEIGHNHQNGDWTFEGTGEVTVNLFSMYVLETVCGLTPQQATSRALGGPSARIQKYLANPDFQQWKQDPFLALAMYAQLRMAFGWESFQKVIAEYRALPSDQRPRGDDQKRDQWMVRFSKATGKNLGPFFQAWGVPTSEKARASIAGLPTWMPDAAAPPAKGQ